MIWNQDQIDRLRDLWLSGSSGSQIGAELGMTRSAVIGKANRLGLRKAKVEPRRAPRKRVRTTAQPLTLQKPVGKPPTPVELPKPIEGGISIVALEPHHCRAVVGTGDDGLARFCGSPKELRVRMAGVLPQESPYCHDHGSQYYQRS